MVRKLEAKQTRGVRNIMTCYSLLASFRLRAVLHHPVSNKFLLPLLKQHRQEVITYVADLLLHRDARHAYVRHKNMYVVPQLWLCPPQFCLSKWPAGPGT